MGIWYVYPFFPLITHLHIFISIPTHLLLLWEAECPAPSLCILWASSAHDPVWSIHYWPMAQPCWLSLPWVPVAFADTSDSVKSFIQMPIHEALAFLGSCGPYLSLFSSQSFHVVYHLSRSVWFNFAMWFGNTASFLLNPAFLILVPGVGPRTYLPSTQLLSYACGPLVYYLYLI